MKIVSSTLKRAVGPALVAGLVVTSAATPAAAQTPGSTAFRLFDMALLQARSGVANHVTARVDPITHHLIFTDTTGIAVGPGCTRVPNDPNSADCGVVTSIAVQLGDGNDTFDGSMAPVNSTVDAGTGVDMVTTNCGNDTIGVQDNAGGDVVNCGGGTDTVFRDPGDTVVNCERVF